MVASSKADMAMALKEYGRPQGLNIHCLVKVRMYGLEEMDGAV